MGHCAIAADTTVHGDLAANLPRKGAHVDLEVSESIQTYASKWPSGEGVPYRSSLGVFTIGVKNSGFLRERPDVTCWVFESVAV